MKLSYWNKELAGFTLLESLIALVVVTFLLGIIGIILPNNARLLQTFSKNYDLQYYSGLELIEQELKNAEKVTIISSKLMAIQSKIDQKGQKDFRQIKFSVPRAEVQGSGLKGGYISYLQGVHDFTVEEKGSNLFLIKVQFVNDRKIYAHLIEGSNET